MQGQHPDTLGSCWSQNILHLVQTSVLVTLVRASAAVTQEGLFSSKRTEGTFAFIYSSQKGYIMLLIRYAEIGLVSWGIASCVDRPMVFSRVSEYKDWIKSVAPGTLDSKCME